MSRIEKLAHRVARVVERPIDEIKHRLDRRFGDGPVQVLPYRGYGTAREVVQHGRVLEDKGLGREIAPDDASVWESLERMYRRFESDEIRGARVRGRFAGDEVEVTTGPEGYFEAVFHPREPLFGNGLWHEARYELLFPERPGFDQGEPVERERGSGWIVVPPAENDFVVVSDVDDTIVETHATSTIKMLKTVLLSSTDSRLAFPGVAAFYRALHRGSGTTPRNPVFYVSSSPWNLYDVLEELMELKDIPAGPLLLRDFGIDRDKFIHGTHAEHKLGRIEHLLDTYPEQCFLLIGDSGQRDTEIYRRVIEDFPGRVLAAYIRNVSPGLGRSDEVREVAEEVTASGTPMLLMDDTVAAAEHAAENGWIDPAALPEIRGEKVKDEG